MFTSILFFKKNYALLSLEEAIEKCKCSGVTKHSFKAKTKRYFSKKILSNFVAKWHPDGPSRLTKEEMEFFVSFSPFFSGTFSCSHAV